MTPEPPSSRIESSDPRGDSAERVQPTLDAALFGTFVWSVDDDRWEADARTWELFGLPPNGTSDLAARLHGDDAARYAAALTAAADPTGDGALHEVVRVDLPDGTPRSVELAARMFFGSDPRRADRLVGIAVDVTARAVRERSEQFLTRLADALRWLADPVDVQAEASGQLGEHLGADRVVYGEVLDDGVHFRIERSYAVRGPALVGRYRLTDFGSGVLQAVRSGRTFAERDVAANPALTDAQRRAYAAVGARAYIDVPLVKAGRLVAFLAVVTDVPRRWTEAEVAVVENVAERTWAAVERARAEAALRESELRFRQVVDVSPQFVWVRRADGALEFTNKRWQDFSGRVPGTDPDAGLLGSAIHPDERPHVLERWEAAVAATAPFEMEMRLRDRAGDYRWTLVRFVPFQERAGEPARWFGVGTDIDARRRAEEILRAEEQRERQARRRADLLADVVRAFGEGDDVAAALQRLVDLLVPDVADAAYVEIDAENGPPRRLVERGPTGAPAREVIPLSDGGGRPMRLVLELIDGRSRPSLAEDLVFLRDAAERVNVLLTAVRVRAEEHRIALGLQRALLPAEVVVRPDVPIAARYEAGSDVLEVGGDWYDSFELPDGRIAVAVGDVVGHGLEAAAAMGRMRVAMAALAPHAPHPGQLLSQLDAFAAGTDGAEFATACYATFEPATRELRFASAGHPPMLVVPPDGAARWLMDGRSPPIMRRVHSVGPRDGSRPHATTMLGPGSLLIAFSDGLVERRGEPITAGLARLEHAAVVRRGLPVDQLCDHLLEDLGVAVTRDDDVVLLCLRVPPVGPIRFERRLLARAVELRTLREALREWLAGRVTPDVTADLLLAIGEACANSIEHAYGDGVDGVIDVAIELSDAGELLVVVRDFGMWKAPAGGATNRRRGTSIMRHITSDFRRRSTSHGTTVTFRMPTGGAR